MKFLSKTLTMTLTFYSFLQSAQPHHVITFFVKDLEKEKKQTKNPFLGINKKIIKNAIKNKTPKNIFALYHGYIALSDDFGQITLPRQTHKEDFNILVTPKIDPVFMFPNTISHWEIPKDTESKLFTISKNEKKEKYYWTIKEIEPTNKISLDTIIIIANHKNVVIKPGEYATTDLSQLVLPDIYVKKEFDSTSNALFILQIKKFFGSINFIYDVKEKGYSRLINN